MIPIHFLKWNYKFRILSAFYDAIMMSFKKLYLATKKIKYLNFLKSYKSLKKELVFSVKEISKFKYP